MDKIDVALVSIFLGGFILIAVTVYSGFKHSTQSDNFRACIQSEKSVEKCEKLLE